MIIAGLTGGIASGKSTVSTFFQELGAVVIDADRIARKVVGKGLPAWRKIKDHYGREVLLPGGEIDREKLGRIVFHNSHQRAVLNRIVHPHVFEEMDNQVRRIHRRHPDAVVIQDVPLLIESGMHTRMAKVILVYVPKPIQLQRLMNRDGVSETDARARISSQMDIEKKRHLADFVIDNGGTRQETREQTRAVYDALKRAADLQYDSNSV
ncbi:MAG: dephospho-CoA kinase [Thermodesulfobacteriota bacterium]